jgi:signal transduction histidine kinase
MATAVVRSGDELVTPAPQPDSRERSRIPTTGMRGGLGRTLLTAFLVLAIVPLSAITWYATQRERDDIQREVTAKLSSVSALLETQIRQWVGEGAGDLRLMASLPSVQESAQALIRETAGEDAARESLDAQLRALLAHDSVFSRLAVLDDADQVLLSIGVEDLSPEQAPSYTPEQWACLRSTSFEQNAGGLVVSQPIVASPFDGRGLGTLVGWFNPCELVSIIHTLAELETIGEVYLVHADGRALSDGQKLTSPGIESALSGQHLEGLSTNYAGVPVIGVYRWMPELGLVLVAEQAQQEAFAPMDNVIAAVVGATLGVALVTAVIAAVVTRQITRPIVQLTESALRIAEGDMSQRVPVKSRDEIGILAYVFNRMASELKTLYDDLEEKVAQRTALLQKANYQIQRRAIQLGTTVEVSQAVTSILEPDQLLREVVRLVYDSFFSCYFVGIYFVDESGKWAILREATGGSKRVRAAKSKPASLEGEGAVGRAAMRGEPCIVKCGSEGAEEMFLSPYVRAEAALPLKMGNQIIGVLDILSTEEEDFGTDDVSVLQNVANQIAIALENARTYITEREAAKRLRELDQSKRRFLVNMSHELRTPLTNIIGFSRLMLKGISGPLNEQQQADTDIIYHNGQHLLGLINDLLDISQIEAGLMELEFRDVNLADLINSVMATASALVRDKEVELRQEIPADLPTVQADATRIRQVLLRLLTNAAKFTQQGIITVRTQMADEQVLVSVSDTGWGIPPDDFDRIFQRFEQGSPEHGRRPNGAGLGLALSREFVEMHGGSIWVESEVGQGSTFTFSLPISQRAKSE